MKILFVTNVRRYNYTEPLGLMYLSAVVKQAGHESRIAFDSFKTLERIVTDWQPDVVGYTVTTHEHQCTLDLNRKLKSIRGFFSIFGGPHATFSPEMVAEEGVDAICRGEGEGAIVDLANALENGESVQDIPNLWVKDADGTIHKNAVRPLIEDLDNLPFPDRESYYCLFNRPGEQGIARFVAGRGCPFNCTFCFNKKYFKEIYKDKGKRVRWRSPESIVSEIEEVARKYPLKLVHFSDDVFPGSRKWLAEFGRLYGKRVELPFICYQRFERVTPETSKLMKEAGCEAVLLGIETGNEELRREMLHRRMTNDEIRAGCKMLHDAGLKVQATNIIGIPGETVDSAMDTLRLNLECGVEVANAFFFHPFPHTELGDMALSMGLYDGNIGGLGNFQVGVDSWKIPEKEKLVRLRALFTPTISMPFLAPLVPLLVRLPLTSLYQVLSKIFVGYQYRFRLYPVRQKPLAFLRMGIRYLLGRGPF